MTIKVRSDLSTEIDSQLPDNTTRAITAEIVRAVLHDLLDSGLLSEDLVSGLSISPTFISSASGSANNNPSVILLRDITGPPANQHLGGISMRTKSSDGTVKSYATLIGYVFNSMVGSEEGAVAVLVQKAGSFVTQWILGKSIFPIALGLSDTGDGTINAVGYYKNGVALSDIYAQFIQATRSADANVANNTNVRNWFVNQYSNGATVEAAIYEFAGELILDMSAATGTTDVTIDQSWSGTATLGSISYYKNPTEADDPTTSIARESVGILFASDIGAPTASDIRCKLHGRITFSTAGTFLPLFGFGRAPGAQMVLKAGTWWKMRKVVDRGWS